ncbi:hypothetical protein MY3296_003100 [Beauveria thailandica]
MDPEMGKWLEIDPFGTLKLIFDARPIHPGKSSRDISPGPLACHEPSIRLGDQSEVAYSSNSNTNPIEVDSDINVVHTERKDEDDGPSRFKVLFGVSPGYR